MEQHPADQAETIAFLMRPQSYGDWPGPVERIDTHGAIIFLAGERAYKLKRAVKLPYLDFSTLDTRRTVCERELALNRRTAPSLYLDRLAVTRGADGALHLGGEGEPVDWLVVMRRFPQTALLGRMCTDGRLDIALMPPLARAIRRFHEEAERRPDAPAYIPSFRGILATIEETLLGAEAAPLELDAAPYLAALRQELQAREALMLQRRREGYVRRCHGDLHLKNIVLLDGEPVPFDCLEFDEDLATIDVLYDLAFLLMDLWHRGRKAEASAVLNGYCEAGMAPGAWAGLGLLPLFLSLRAGVRAMVGVHGLGVTPAERRGAAEDGVRAYTALARALLRPAPPMLVCVGGLSGTGKTTLARALAPLVGAAPGALHLRTDVVRKLMQGLDPATRLDSAAYGEEARRQVYARLMEKAAAILASGHSAIIDAVFSEPDRREAVATLARQAGVPLHALWLEAEAGQMIARVEQRRGDASDAGPEVVRQQLRAHAGPPPGWRRIEAGGPPERTLASARAACGLL